MRHTALKRTRNTVINLVKFEKKKKCQNHAAAESRFFVYCDGIHAARHVAMKRRNEIVVTNEFVAHRRPSRMRVPKRGKRVLLRTHPLSERAFNSCTMAFRFASVSAAMSRVVNVTVKQPRELSSTR